MAKKDDRKKQKKRQKEHKRAARHRAYLDAKAKETRYPKIIVEPEGGAPALVDAVKAAIADFSFTDEACCSERFRDLYQELAANGVQQLYWLIEQVVYHSDLSDREARLRIQEITVPFLTHFGDWVFQRLPKTFTSQFCPDHFFRVDHENGNLVIRFNFLDRITLQGERLYGPPNKIFVPMQGVQWQLALYRHALDQLCLRLIPAGELSYNKCIDLYYRFVQERLTYTPIFLHEDQPAVRIDFVASVDVYFYREYASLVRTVLGLADDHEFAEGEKWSIVLGYLPIHVQGKYARAKTFLLPGFIKTPEYGLFRGAAVTREERAMLLAMTDETKRTSDLAGDTVAAIKWYHDNGVPQVFRATQAADDA